MELAIRILKIHNAGDYRILLKAQFMSIGRMFPLEETGTEIRDYPRSLGADVRFCMSGRCAIYLCLLDILRRDEKRVAYLPAYTCETVIGCL